MDTPLEQPALSARLSAAQQLLTERRNDEAYAALEALIPELLGAGLVGVLGHTLRGLGDIASARGQWARAAQDYRSAEVLLGQALAQGVADAGAEEAARAAAAQAADASARLFVPFSSAAQALSAHLQHLRLHVDRAAQRNQDSGRYDETRRFPVKVTGEEFAFFLQGTLPYSPVLLSLERRIVASRFEMAQQISASEAAGVVVPAERIRRAFGLSLLERDVLLAAAAPALEPSFQRAYTHAWADFTRRDPDVAFLSELCALSDAEAAEATDALAATGALAGHRLVMLDSPRPPQPVSPLYQRVLVAPSVLQVLRGKPALDAVPGLIRLGSEQPLPLSDVLLPEPARAHLRAAANVTGSGGRVLLVTGPKGVGKRTALEALASELGMGAAALSGKRLQNWPQRSERVREFLRDCRLQGILPIVELPDLGTDPPADQLAALEDLALPLAHCGTLVAATAVLVPAPLRETLPQAVEVPLPMPSPDEQHRLWASCLAAQGRYRSALEPVLARLVARVRLPPGAIYRAAELAHRRSPVGAHLDPNELFTAGQEQLSHRLHTVAQRIPVTFRWDDLVVPPSTEEKLREIAASSRNRARVLGDWGFARKLPYGRALSALFYGPPGTGKTMGAGVIARELDMELYQIDLSQVVSKWIGETEKNLARVFDEAGRGNAVLLFDEADSLFARRTEVKTSVDRYSNLEVNFLLQRMEDFEGVIILTTNHDENIDPAFRRRIRFKVHFPAPDEQARTALWRSIIPPEAEVEDDLPIEQLAEAFELSGGEIKNAVLRAAFQAAEDGTCITAAHLVRSSIAEYREMGRLVRDDPDTLAQEWGIEPPRS